MERLVTVVITWPDGARNVMDCSEAEANNIVTHLSECKEAGVWRVDAPSVAVVDAGAPIWTDSDLSLYDEESHGMAFACVVYAALLSCLFWWWLS